MNMPNIYKSFDVNVGEETIWKFLPPNRAIELFTQQRIHFSKTKFMNDEMEGYASVQQIREVFKLDKVANICVDQLATISEYVKQNKELIKIILSQTANSESEFSSADLFEHICKMLKLSKSKRLIKAFNSSASVTADYMEFLCSIEDATEEFDTEFYTESDLQKRMRFIKEHTYLSSWNNNAEINMVLWEAYAKESFGIAIKSSVKRIESAINYTLRRTNELSDCKICFEKVKYDNKPKFLYEDIDGMEDRITFDIESPKIQEKFQFARASLSYKKESYRSEEELRIVAINEQENIDDDNLYFIVDKNAIEEIHINPTLSRPQEYAENLSILSKTFLQSDIPIFYKGSQIKIID